MQALLEDEVLNVYRLEQEIQEAMRAARVPGLALAIVWDGEITYARGFGTTCIEEWGRPVTPQTLFRIGSVSKPLTGTAAMRLVEQGRVDLDCPVQVYVPWLTLSDPAAAARVTLRMLLSHTAGLPHDPRFFERREPQALEACIRDEVPRYPLVAPPGTTYSYSNLGIRIASHVLEVVSGVPFPRLMQALVFDPLDMRRTTYDPTVAMTYPLAQGHTLADGGTLEVAHRYSENAANYGSGQAISTVLDLANFAILHLRQGTFRGRRLLEPASVAEMHRPHVATGAEAGEAYGLTFMLRRRNGDALVCHGGSIPCFVTAFEMAPRDGSAVIMTFNLHPDPGLRRYVDHIWSTLRSPA